MAAAADDPGGSGEPARAKGRTATQLRPLLCERGLLRRADGSAKWAAGGSAVLAAVHGPAAAGPRREHPERAVVEVIYKPRNGLPTSWDREVEEVLRQAVEGAVLAQLHPRTAVTVVVQVLAADGGLLACAANAACAALVDAGVPLSSLFAATGAAVTESGCLLLDPDAEEEAAARATFCFAYPFRHDLGPPGKGASGGGSGADAAAAAGGAAAAAAAAAAAGAEGGGQQQQQQQLVVDKGILMCHATGRFSSEQLLVAAEACRRGCGGVAKFCRMSLLAGFKDALQPR